MHEQNENINRDSVLIEFLELKAYAIRNSSVFVDSLCILNNGSISVRWLNEWI